MICELLDENLGRRVQIDQQGPVKIERDRKRSKEIRKWRVVLPKFTKFIEKLVVDNKLENFKLTSIFS